MNRYWVHRTYCDTLHEMRTILEKTSILRWRYDKRLLESLIEECQTYGNRMEASLSYKGDLDELHEERKKLIKEVEELKKQLPEKKDDDI